MKHIEKINNHNFMGSTITYWNCYDDTRVSLNVHGDFGPKETSNSEYKHFELHFSGVGKAFVSVIGGDFTDNLIESINVEKQDDLCHVRLKIAGSVIEFSCEDVWCRLLRYKGVSYKNMYGTPEYDAYVQKISYVKQEQYICDRETFDLPDGYQLSVVNYSDMQGNVVRAVMQHCILKKCEQVIYEYDTTYERRQFTEFIHHSNGHRYWPFYVDLYGISYMDMENYEVYNYVPQGHDNEYGALIGESFIITDIHYDINTNLIAYGGCYWAGTSDVMVGDFSKPLNFNPKLIGVHDIIDPEWDEIGDIDFVRFEDGKLIVKCDDGTEREVDMKFFGEL